MQRSWRWVLLLTTLLGTGGCTSEFMQTTALQRVPAAGKALVTFIRPSFYGGPTKFGIWDGDCLVGILEAKTLLQYQAEPGTHLFLARAENWSYLKADLKMDRSYFVISRVFPGFLKTRSAFDPLQPGDDLSEELLPQWLTELPAREFKAEEISAYVAPRLEQVREAVDRFEEGKVRFEVLDSSDFLGRAAGLNNSRRARPDG